MDAERKPGEDMCPIEKMAKSFQQLSRNHINRKTGHSVISTDLADNAWPIVSLHAGWWCPLKTCSWLYLDRLAMSDTSPQSYFKTNSHFHTVLLWFQWFGLLVSLLNLLQAWLTCLYLVLYRYVAWLRVEIRIVQPTCLKKHINQISQTSYINIYLDTACILITPPPSSCVGTVSILCIEVRAVSVHGPKERKKQNTTSTARWHRRLISWIFNLFLRKSGKIQNQSFKIEDMKNHGI